jgi:hypothetical protein
MKVPTSEIETKKKVGKLGSKGVWMVKTRGGLFLIATDGGGEVIGSGPHRAVAKAIAQRRNPDLEWTELSKSEWVDPETFAHLMPKYESMTDDLRRLQGR